MPVYRLPYGKEKITLDLAGLEPSMVVELIEPGYVAPAADPLQVVSESLDHPVDGRSLTHYQGVQSVAIAVNDKTRPVPHEHLLPPLMEKLKTIGVADSAVKFILATGTHIPMPAEEFGRVLPPEIYQRYFVLSHNCDDAANLVSLGTTSRGTQVLANRSFMAADLRIVVGNIEPHHFAGFSGGYKTASIGLAGRATINHNHAMLIEPAARIAEFVHNPLRQDIEEIGDLMNVQFALNAVLNGEKKIVRAVSGHPRAVMQAGIPISQEICQIQSGKGYDLVIASAGGAPKDINFYQAQKALTHASLFTRDGGVIILVAACPEGSGSRAYEEFMQGVDSPQAVFEKFKREGFRVGPHKAFQVARDAARVQIILVSAIAPEQVKRLLMTPAENLQTGIEIALQKLASDKLASDKLASDKPASVSGSTPIRVAVLPRATNTIPSQYL